VRGCGSDVVTVEEEVMLGGCVKARVSAGNEGSLYRTCRISPSSKSIATLANTKLKLTLFTTIPELTGWALGVLPSAGLTLQGLDREPLIPTSPLASAIPS
jgi:hypothetical protein